MNYYNQDSLVEMENKINSQQREIDELKAQNAVLIKSGNMMKVNLSYSNDPFSGGYISQWKRALSKSPKQCLLEHDKVVAKAAWLDGFNEAAGEIDSTYGLDDIYATAKAGRYANKLGDK